MATLTTQFKFKVGGNLTDAASVVLSDPNGVYGIKRLDTDAVVVAAGAAATRFAKGIYRYAFTVPEAGLTYSRWVRVVYDGVPYHFEHEFTDTGSTTGPVVSYCPIVATYVAPSSASPKDWPVIELQQCIAVDMQVQLQENNGDPLLISAADGTTGAVANDPYDSDAAVPTPGVQITYEDITRVETARLWLKQHPTDNQIVEVEGEYLGAGIFEFHFSEANTSKPGLFVGDIQLLDDTEQVIFLRRCYVEIEQNSLDSTFVNEPLTISEVRLALRDYADANDLLDAYEFSAREIAKCIRDPVDYWNEALPPVAPMTMASFPYRKHWLDATIACLYKLIARWYRRNYLAYQAGGVAVEDRNKAPEYEAVAKDMWTEYREWVRERKIAINMDLGWGFVEGGWSS